MSIDARIHKQLLASFRTEVVEHIQTISKGLLVLEQDHAAGKQHLDNKTYPPEQQCDGQQQSALEIALCAAHSLKGAARAVKATLIERLAHSIEGVLDGLRQGSLELTPEVLAACHQALGATQAVQAAYEAGRTTPSLEATSALACLEACHPALMTLRQVGQRKQPEAIRAAQEKDIPSPAISTVVGPAQHHVAQDSLMRSDSTIQVSASKFDVLLSALTKLRVSIIRAEQREEQFHQARESVALWQSEWSSIRNTHNHLLRQTLDCNCEKRLTRELTQVLGYVSTVQGRMQVWDAWLNDLSQQCTADTTRLSAAIDQLEREARHLHMQSLSTITTPLKCMVSDLARQAGKEAILKVAGDETELDMQVLEQLKAPLIHLLRNAIDHGIEPPEEREALGKPRAGTIQIIAEPADQRVIIRVADDGAGLDLEAIRQTVAQQDQEQAQTLAETDAAELIFDVGISTSPAVTGLSGRGVGLTVVRRNVEALRGKIDLDWQPGAGTVFTLTLPRSLNGAQKAGSINSPVAE